MKKYILFIVEGENDKREIQTILRAACGSSFFDNYVDAYHVHKGDVTTETDTTDKTIIEKLNKIVISWRKGGEHPFQKIPVSDIYRIIQVVDTDGVFVPEHAIVNTDDGKTQYFEKAIHCYNRNLIITRNRKKAKVLGKLLETKRIDNVPYELYFASCNMDHLLFDERNLDPSDKKPYAMRFASKCKNKDDLKECIFAEDICAKVSHADSWIMIQNGYNSLQRHTNLNLLLNAIEQ